MANPYIKARILAGSSTELMFLGTLDASITPGMYRLAIAYEVGTQLHDIPLADGSGTGIEITVLGEGTGLGLNSGAGFTCYPNLATTHVNIRAEGGMERVLLHSLSGMLLMDEDGHGEAAYRLDLDRLPQGTYLLTVETPDATYTQRIIKE